MNTTGEIDFSHVDAQLAKMLGKQLPFTAHDRLSACWDVYARIGRLGRFSVHGLLAKMGGHDGFFNPLSDNCLPAKPNPDHFPFAIVEHCEAVGYCEKVTPTPPSSGD